MVKEKSDIDENTYSTHNYSQINKCFDNMNDIHKIPLKHRKFDLLERYIKLITYVLITIFILYLVYAVAQWFLSDKSNLPNTIIKEVPIIVEQPVIAGIEQLGDLASMKSLDNHIKNLEKKTGKTIKSVTNYVIFKKVALNSIKSHTVITGIKFKSAKDKYPVEQWCYVASNKILPEDVSVNVSVGIKNEKGKAIFYKMTTSKAEKIKIKLKDLQLARTKCEFF